MSDTNGNILLIDADPELRESLQRDLAEQDITLVCADGIGGAMVLLAEDPGAVCVVISEAELPDGDGLDLIEKIRSLHLACPVIFLANSGETETVKRVLRAGAFEYYQKPVAFEVLWDAICRGMGHAAGRGGDRRRLVPRLSPEANVPGYRDDLTGLASHRFIVERLGRMRKDCAQQDLPMSLLLVDIDDFRNLNTSRGFSACDRLLVDFANRMTRCVRTDDIVGRYGGDEFLVVLPGGGEKAGRRVAERIIDCLRDEPLTIDGSPVKIPVCLGLVEIHPNDTGEDFEFLDRVIEAVYHAKLSGPETIVTWRPGLTQQNLSWEFSAEPVRPDPDVESINIMMWRFRELNRQVGSVIYESLRVLVAAVEARDPYTRDHSIKVAAFSKEIAGEMGLPARQVQTIYSAALLHDIGKIGIPDAVLIKPGRLTDDERELIEQHPLIGYNILQQTRFFTAELPLVRHHHERIDGRGYPDGLIGEAIPAGARIIHVADAVEAMLAARSYKRPFPLEFVIDQLRRMAGSQFDQTAADIALQLIQRGVLDVIWTKNPVMPQPELFMQTEGL